MPSTHHGVVALITIPERTLFLLQQKDEAYRPFPLGLSLFGGAVEPGEPPEAALVRELHEELGSAAAPLLAASPNLVFPRRTLHAGFVLSLYEIVLDPPALASLAEAPVLEGKRSVLLDREALGRTSLIWGLGEIVTAYLERWDALSRR